RHAVDLAVQHVDLVRELVNADVVALAPATLLDLAPGEQNGSLLPCLAAQKVVPRWHDSIVVDDLAVADEELIRIEHDRREGRVTVETEIQDRQRAEHRDAHAHLVGDRETVRWLEALLVQEQQRELA